MSDGHNMDKQDGEIAYGECSNEEQSGRSDGKGVLKTQKEFYLADTSLKSCMMDFNPKVIAAMFENIDIPSF